MQRLSQQTQKQCLTCETVVTSDFARVLGDQNGDVYRCHKCDTNGRLFQGSAAGKQIDDPDPLDEPERFQSYRDLDVNVRAKAAGQTEGPNG